VTPGPCMGRPFKGLYDIVYFRFLRSSVCQFLRVRIATHGRTTEYSYIVISRFLPDFPCAYAPLKPDALCGLFPVPNPHVASGFAPETPRPGFAT